MPRQSTKAGLSVSMIVGTLLIPLSAVAALWLTDAGGVGEEAAGTTTTAAPIPTVPAAIAVTSATTTEADIEAACGPEGLQLSELEKEGTISEVQQAALSALRQFCEQQGLPLPPPPAPVPVVETVSLPPLDVTTQSVQVVDSTVQNGERADDHEDDDDEDREDDDREDDDHEDEDHHESEDDGEHDHEGGD